MTSIKACFAFVLLLALSACKLGPNYQRPPMDVPGDYRGVAPEAQAQPPAETPTTTPAPPPAQQPPAAQPASGQVPSPPTGMAAQAAAQPVATPSQPSAQAPAAAPPGQPFGELQWTSVFQDEALQGLIKEALANNYDLRVAATRVAQAAANVGIVRANQFPSVEGSASIANERNFQFPGAPTFGTLGISMTYIVDFWGQYRRATEAARAVLLST